MASLVVRGPQGPLWTPPLGERSRSGGADAAEGLLEEGAHLFSSGLPALLTALIQGGAAAMGKLFAAE